MGDRLAAFLFQKEDKQRLDIFLTACMPEFSRSRVQGLIKDGFVMVNGVQVIKTGTNLEYGARVDVRVPPPQPSGLLAEAISLDILFENNDLIVVNKPAGMVVHPAPGHDSGTLVNAVLAHAPDIEGIGGEDRPGVVHRLDKETSGLILLAKNERSHRWLQEQFKSRKVQKIYLALVDGAPPTPTGRVEAPVGRSTSHRKQMAVTPAGKGREAISEYRTLESFTNHTFLEVHPLTGRTHQIRLHMAFLDCPIVGDKMYGHHKASLAVERHLLHAYRLSITIPGETNQRLFQAPIPADMEIVLEQLRAQSH